MNTTAFIKSSLHTSLNATKGLILDLQDQPLAQPTKNGGNHAHWILGHLVYSESSVIHTILLGNSTSPHDHLQSLFGHGSQPCPNAKDYPSFDQLLKEWDTVREFTLQTLDTFSDEQLDNPAPGCPEEWTAWFGTIGNVFTAKIIHPTMHYGQLSDIRKSLGRELFMI